MSDKCEGCPLKKVQVVETHDIATGVVWTQQDTGYGWCPAMHNDCHLIPADFTVIKQAIAGEGRLVLTDELMVKVLSPECLCPARIVTEEFLHDLLDSARPRR